PTPAVAAMVLPPAILGPGPRFVPQSRWPFVASKAKKLSPSATLLPTKTRPPDTLGVPAGGQLPMPMSTCHRGAIASTDATPSFVSPALKPLRPGSPPYVGQLDPAVPAPGSTSTTWWPPGAEGARPPRAPTQPGALRDRGCILSPSRAARRVRAPRRRRLLECASCSPRLDGEEKARRLDEGRRPRRSPL